MHILVLQHARVEHPGIFREFLEQDGHTWEPIHLDQGESLPDHRNFDAVWAMGGPMDVWQEDEYPWLKAEKSFIRNVVAEQGLPFFGFCLGHQLLAEALGGSVGKSETPEIGVMDVMLTDAGATGILFDGVEEKFGTLQWHGAEVKTLPPGAQCLATSPLCSIQAMRWNTRAYSMQFHVEIEEDTVENWSEIPEYTEALTKAMGDGGVQQLTEECARNMSSFNKTAERIYINWLQTSAQT